ncbi:MAG: efflux RND transporter periplasmic adaptor subunit, partial [Paracoccaceae bacterium]
RISIKQADLVRTGMFLQAEIEISEREVVAVPITAIGTDDLGSFVMTVDSEGKVRRAAVTIGVRDGGKIEILSGVEAGEQVVSKAASFVRDGDMVQPIIDAAAQGA